MHSSMHDAFGRAVGETRARRDLSKEELGFAPALHRNYVGAIERGEINPTQRVLLKLADGLHVREQRDVLWVRCRRRSHRSATSTSS